MSTGTHVLTTLAPVASASGGLVADANGNLYGASAFGTIFELSDTGFVVPEPASVALLAFAPILLMGRRGGCKPRITRIARM